MPAIADHGQMIAGAIQPARAARLLGISVFATEPAPAALLGNRVRFTSAIGVSRPLPHRLE